MRKGKEHDQTLMMSEALMNDGNVGKKMGTKGEFEVSYVRGGEKKEKIKAIPVNGDQRAK